MADSANILSILAQLGQLGQSANNGILPVTFQPPPAAPPVSNVLQAAMAPPALPTAAPAPPPPPPTVAPTAAPVDHPRKRLSVIDAIGRIADTLATVGGSQPMYEPTLEHQQDRMNQVDLDALKKTLTEQQVAAGALEPQVAERKRIGVALGGISGQPNAAELWPSIAEQAGIDPQKTAAIGHILQANPAAAGILAKSLGADPDNLGKNVLFGTTTDGKTVAYQVGPDGHPHVLDFGTTGITPSEPVKVVNTGGSSVIVGAGGTVKKILPNTAPPGTVLTATTSRENNRDTNQTNLTIAGMPARASGGANSKTSDPRAGLTIISDIQQSFDNLHKLQALPGEGGAVGNLIGAVGRTSLGQALEAKTGVSQAAQEREILGKNLANLQSDLIKSLPGNATRTRFEQEIQKKRLPDPNTMNYATANRAIAQIREAYLTALRSQTPVKAAPANNGWSVVGVK